MQTGRRALGAVGRARAGLISLVGWISGFLFLVLFGLNLVQIVLRPVNGGWIWVTDFSRLVFAWVIMLGAAAAYGKYEHITVSFAVERLPGPLRSGAAVLVRIVELLVALILVVAGLAVVQTRMGIDYIQLGWPTGLAFASVPVLGVLILVLGLTAKPHIPTTEERTEEEIAHGRP